MDTSDISATLDRIDPSASVDKAFGDPIETAQGTIIPVARVISGFGSGFGLGGDGESSGGGGRGGGVAVSPIGVIAVEADESRFIRTAGGTKRVGAAIAAGVLAGIAIGVAVTRILGRHRDPDE